MKYNIYRSRCHERFVFKLLIACLVPLGSGLVAQETAPADEEVYELSPFVVDSSDDLGYVTTQSLSGSRFAQKLSDIPASISVITEEVMDDLGVFDLQEAMDWSVNTIASGTGDSSASEATGMADGERRSNDIRIRGILSTSSRNFFKWSVNSDRYNIGRIDTSRGPNAMLFGASSLAGLSNITTKQAVSVPIKNISLNYDSYGGGRVSLDVNMPLIKDKLAVRVNTFYQDTDHWRTPGRDVKKGIALASTWQVNDKFTIRAEYEKGESEGTFAKTALIDHTDSWDHVFLLDSPGSITQAEANAAGYGVTVESNIYYVDSSRPEDGIINWVGAAKSMGTASYVLPYVNTDEFGEGIYDPALLTQTAMLTGDPSLSKLIMPDWDYGNMRSAGNVQTDYDTASIFFEYAVTENFFVEVAANHQEQERIWHVINGSPQNIYYDLSSTLPDGYTIDGSSANPNVLKPFVSGQPGVRQDYVESDEIRALAFYKLTGSWYDINLGGNISYLKSSSGQYRRALVVTNGSNANLSAAVNKPRFRYYLTEPEDDITVYQDGEVYTVGDSTLEFLNVGNGAGQAHVRSKQWSGMMFMGGSWGKEGRLKTTLGIRRDKYDSSNYNDHVYDSVTKLYQYSDLSGSVTDTIDSPSAGLVYQVTDWLSAYYNYSKSFVFANKQQLNFQGGVIDPPIGESSEFGIRFHLGNKLYGSIGRYESEQINNVLNSNTYLKQIRIIYDEFWADDFPQYVDSATLVAEGYELQLTANPLKSWTVRFNLAMPENKKTGSFQGSLYPFLDENISEWYALATANPDEPNDTVLAAITNLENRRASQIATDGLPATKLNSKSGSLLTKYTFRDGKLKGLAIGGGAKFRGEKVVSVTTDSDGNITSEFKMDAYTEYTAFASYPFKWKDMRWKINVNVVNPFDHLNFGYTTVNATTGAGRAYRISSPRQIRVGLDLNF